jgi:ribosomal protein S12 methylthiotransferase accessory factor
VTRLAQLTGLDRIGFPVWQAVRPEGRAQSVHQGKGPTDLDAKIGALGEALESHCAERVVADGPRAAWHDLPPDERCPEPSDCYAGDLPRPDPGVIDWCKAADLRSGRAIYLPHLFVSLDFTLPTDSAIERCSAGLAIGTCEREAVETALLEVIERDAVGEWRRMPAAAKARQRVDRKSIPFSWFSAWAARIRAAGAQLRVFACRAIEGSHVSIVYLSGMEAFGGSQRLFMGSAAHGNPEVALFKALAEAVQSRLTFIAAARDDVLPSHYAKTPPGTLLGGAGLGEPRLDFQKLEPLSTAPRDIAERLTALGYGTAAVKRLDQKGSVIPVVKAFVPGLGSLCRERRPSL